MAEHKTVTYHAPDDLRQQLEAFVAENPAWSKSEASVVALAEFLRLSDKEKDAALVRFRSRLKQAASVNPPKKK